MKKVDFVLNTVIFCDSVLCLCLKVTVYSVWSHKKYIKCWRADC